VTPSKVEFFFEHFSVSDLTENVWRSLSSLSTSSNAPKRPNRWSSECRCFNSHSQYSSILSLKSQLEEAKSQIESNDRLFKEKVAEIEKQKREIEELSKEKGSELKLKEEQLLSLSQTNQKLQLEIERRKREFKKRPPPPLTNIIPFETDSNRSNGLFSRLRAQCNGQNPHKAGLVSVTTSGVFSSSCNGENVLDWGTDNSWYSQNEPNSWIDFNLLNKSFILKGLSIYTQLNWFARKWELLGSDGDEEWTKIYESNDNRLNTRIDSVVNIEIPNTKPFKRFRIVAKDFWLLNNCNCFSFCSIEFYGNLLLQ
jgi:hypothetical protein